jgi:hypothetical protein
MKCTTKGCSQQVQNEGDHLCRACVLWLFIACQRMDSMSADELGRVLEKLPIETLEFAVKFEALSHPGSPNDVVG